MLQNRNIFIISNVVVVLAILLVVVDRMETPAAATEASPTGTAEGSFFLTTSSQSLSVGEQQTVSLQVRSEIPANTYGTSITFPPELLRVIEIDYDDSFVDLWIEEPTFDNETGLITLAGGSLIEDGFIGEDTLLTFVIEPQQTGAADLIVDIDNSALHAHDGAGTEIPLADTSPLSFTISE